MSNHNPPTNGFDKRPHAINRKGRPRTFDAVRELAQQIAHETAKAGGQEIVIDNKRITVTEAILRSWATSKDARLQQAFMEWAYGKVPDITQFQGHDGKEIVVRFESTNHNAARTDSTTGNGNQ